MRPIGNRHVRRVARSSFAMLFLAICLTLVGAGMPAHAQTKQPVTWALTPLPPAMLEKDGAIVGYGVDILDWFAARLPDYQHQKEIIPLPRLVKTITGPGTYCNIGMNPTEERKKFLHFSEAVLPHLPVSLITNPHREEQIKPFLNPDGEIDLERMITFGKLNGALRSQRSYGATIDAILRRNINNPGLSFIGNDANFLQLIALGRLDWTLYLPAEAEYYRRTKLPGEIFSSWHIAGNDHLMPASIACSKTVVGDAIVAAINTLVKDNPDMPWTRFYASSLSEQDQIRYQQKLRNYQRAPGSSLSQAIDQ